MLLELRIQNLLLIERAELRFGEGLNVITGETGAGKTILAHSLDLLMGGRARPQIVRPGASEAYVEGTFALPAGLLYEAELAEIAERLPEGEGEIVLSRRIGASGRTSAFVQHRSASAIDLQDLGSHLLAFYGQHEHRKLALTSAQLEALDGFAGRSHLKRRAHYREAYAEVAELSRQLAELRERDGARERELDLASFELSEIAAVAPNVQEEHELEAERARLRHAEALREAAAVALAAVVGAEQGEDGAAGLIAAAAAALAAAGGVDDGLDRLAERSQGLEVELSDLASTLRSYLEGIEADPGRLETIEERLSALDRLKRKHGGSIESVLAHAERCRLQIARLENAEELAGELEARLAEAKRRRVGHAGELSEVRRAAARGLESRVGAELAELAMEAARLQVAIEPHPAGFGPWGAETVELRVATNPGMPPSPLRDAASGGELSRVMLALSAVGAGAGGGALVFDEIDAGIGGSTGRAVGEKLRRLASPEEEGGARQVICITHLPQVASLASTHFRIAKSVQGGTTRATVERVEGEELVAEIVRMLGAERTDEAANLHARELLAAA